MKGQDMSEPKTRLLLSFEHIRLTPKDQMQFIHLGPMSRDRARKLEEALDGLCAYHVTHHGTPCKNILTWVSIADAGLSFLPAVEVDETDDHDAGITDLSYKESAE